MGVQTFGVWNLDAAEDEFASRDQRMNVVTNAYMNHDRTIKPTRPPTKKFQWKRFATACLAEALAKAEDTERKNYRKALCLCVSVAKKSSPPNKLVLTLALNPAFSPRRRSRYQWFSV